ncbi:MAG: glycoside hydrolase family 99-like domain-containing protein [Acidobacteriota bacterium]
MRRIALLLVCLEACAATAAYHRLRIEYTTNSDWTTLDLRNPGGVLTMRRMSVTGQPTRVGTQVERLALNQPLSAAQAGQTVGVTVDYALWAAAVDEPLQFLLQKGSQNGAIVRAFALAGGEARLLQEVSHQRVVGTEGRNPLEFSIDLGPLKASPPQRARVGTTSQRMVWAFYYPWYRAGDWSSNQLKDRPATRYSSNDPAAMARHITEAQSAGIDGFISSWWGPGHYTDQNLKLLLEQAREKHFAVTIYFETLTGQGPRGEEEIFNWLAHAITAYGGHPAFFKLNGKPLIVVWASGTVPVATWDGIFGSLRAQGLDAAYLAMGFDPGDLSTFDGLHEYGVFTIADLAGAFARAGRATRYYPLLADSQAPKVWAATAQPGYDERLIAGRRGLYQEREDGAFYRRTFDAALRSDPDWVFVTSWNEWWEHTHIEPSELYGDQYLRITREFADTWKGKRVTAVVNAADYSTGAVAPGELVTLFGSGLGPENPTTLQLDTDGRVARLLSGVRVLFDGLPSPLIYVQARQVNAVTPYGIAGAPSTGVQVEYEGIRSTESVVAVAEAAPAIFQGAILNEDGTVNSSARPARSGSVIMLYATGEGQTNPAGVDGQVATGVLPKPLLPVSVTIGGLAAEVLYAGAAPGMVAGAMQVNARVPAATAAGAATPVVLTVGKTSSAARVTVAVGP